MNIVTSEQFAAHIYQGNFQHAIAARLRELEQVAQSNQIDMEGAKLSTLACAVAGLVCSANPVAATIGLIAGAGYVYTLLEDYRHTGKFFPVPIWRKDATDIAVGIGAKSHGIQIVADAHEDAIDKVCDYLSLHEAREYRILMEHPQEVIQFLAAQGECDRIAAYESFLRGFGVEATLVDVNHSDRMHDRTFPTGVSFINPSKKELPQLPPAPNTESPIMRRDIGTNTRFGTPANGGAVDVPAFNLAGDSNKFDWNRLNTEYDDFPHLFLLGKTGSGKSYLSDRLVRFLEGYCLVITPKRKPKDFVGLQVVGVPYDYRAIYQAMKALEQLMIDREAEMNRTGNDNFTPINVILDELPVSSAGCKDIGLDLVTPLKAIIRAGRTSRIRLIILAQGQEVKALGIEGEGGLRDSLTYVYLKGFAEKFAKDNQIDISGVDRPCLIEGQIADTLFLQQYELVIPKSLTPDNAPEPVSESLPKDIREQLNRAYEMSPDESIEVEEEPSESMSSLPRIRQAFPAWNSKSLEVASAIVDYISSRPDKSYSPSVLKQSMRALKDNAALPTEKIKSLLDLLVGAQLLTEANGKYSAPTTPATDDDDFNF